MIHESLCVHTNLRLARMVLPFSFAETSGSRQSSPSVRHPILRRQDKLLQKYPRKSASYSDLVKFRSTSSLVIPKATLRMEHERARNLQSHSKIKKIIDLLTGSQTLV